MPIHLRTLLRLAPFLAVALLALAVPSQTTFPGANGSPTSAPALTRFVLKSYGNHDELSLSSKLGRVSYDERVKYVRPQYVIDNPAHGAYGRFYGAGETWLLQKAMIDQYHALGIKVIGYIAGGYEGDGPEGGEPRSFSDLEFNKQTIREMASLDGVDGVFIDEVSEYPELDPRRANYLKELTSLAKSYGLIVWGNTGMDQFSDWFFTQGGFDFMQSSESWVGQDLSPIQRTYGSRISVTGFKESYTAQDALRLTLDAMDKGLAFAYINDREYTDFAPWFEEYVDMLRQSLGQPPSTPTPSPTPAATVKGDMNCDGKVESVDALLILREVARLPVSLPAGCPEPGS